MQPYIYEACHTTLLEQEIDFNPNTKKLIQELNHKYGLKVFAKTEVLKNPKGWGSNVFYYLKSDVRDWKEGVAKGDYEEVDAFLLTYNGMSNAMVWSSDNKSNGLTYYFFNPSYYKEKSQNTVDHHTLRSVKLPSLIQNIKKNGAIPKHEPLSYRYIEEISDMVGNVDRILNGKSHHNLHNHECIQVMLNIIKGDTTLHDCNKEMQDKIEDAYKLMKKVDEDAINLKQSLKEKLGSEFHVILTYTHDGYVVGRAKMKYGNDGKLDEKGWIEYTKPLHYVKSLDDYDKIDEIRPILIMQKLKLENEDPNKVRKEYFSGEDKYDDELQIISRRKDRWDSFDNFNHLALFIPKG